MTDPTNVIATFDRAQVLAHAMLRLAPEAASDIWQIEAEPVLATLLFAGAPGQNGGGVRWVRDTVLAIEAGDVFNPPAGTPELYAARVLTVQTLAERQKQSVVKTIKDAVTPWVDDGVGSLSCLIAG